jgi:hypothetical protein
MLLGFHRLLLLAMAYSLLSVWPLSFRGRAIGTSS